MARLREWLDERIDAAGWRATLLDKPIGPHVNWLFTLGSILLFLFAAQVATGILLACYYIATPAQAHDSVSRIMAAVPLGWLVRGLHYWGASFIVVFAVLHAIRVVLYGAYKRPRELTWLFGVALLVLMLGFAFSGYLLPWDQKAYWATVVGTYIAGTIPLIGQTAQGLLRGGADVAGPTLTRFYALHTLVLPALAAVLVFVHVYLVQLHGISGRFPRPEGTDPGAERAPETQSRPFYPHHAIKDTVAVAMVYVVLIALAWFAPAPLEGVANPVDATYVPRPEWYFYPLYEVLKFFDGSMLVVGTVVIPAFTLLALILLPFVDRSPVRDPFSRPIVTTAAASMLVGCAYLVSVGIAGHASRPDLYFKEKRPSNIVLTGALVFEEQKCETCHSVYGNAGRSAPDLWRIGSRRDRMWLGRLFADPDSVLSPGRMPAYHLPERDLAALIEYVAQLDFSNVPAVPVTRAFVRAGGEAYRAGCLECHGEDAGTAALRFSVMGQRRSREWLVEYLTDPAFHLRLAPDAAKLPEARRTEIGEFLVAWWGRTRPKEG